MEKMSINLLSALATAIKRRPYMATYLRFDQNQVYKQHDKVMLDIFVTEAPTVLAYCKSHSMAGRLVISA